MYEGPCIDFRYGFVQVFVGNFNKLLQMYLELAVFLLKHILDAKHNFFI